jgi:hypothetical protein
MPRISHMVEISEAKAIDPELESLLRAANLRVNPG